MPSKPKVDFSIWGTTGLRRFSGRIYEELLPELSGTRWDKAIKEMIEQDATVGAILNAFEWVMRRAPWRVEPFGSESEDEDAATFIDECLTDMSDSYEDTISEITSFLAWGWSYHELIYKQRGGAVDDPTKRSKYDDNKIGWRKWSIRAQETRWRWDFDEDGGIRGMFQIAPPDYIVRYIPITKALLFRTTARKANPEGRSLLRTAYRSWYFLKHFENIEGIGVERDLAGLPVIEAPANIFDSQASAGDKNLLENLKNIVVNIRRDEQEGIVMPQEYDDQGHPRYGLKLLTAGGARQFDTSAVINRKRTEIAMSVLADFVMLGHEKIGTQALASEKIDFFTLAISTFLDSIAGIVNNHAIPRLLRLNGMDDSRPPKLAHGDVAAVDLKELSLYITALSGAGVDLSNPDLKRYLFEIASFPEPPEDEEDMMPPLVGDWPQVPEETAPAPQETGDEAVGEGTGQPSGQPAGRPPVPSLDATSAPTPATPQKPSGARQKPFGGQGGQPKAKQKDWKTVFRKDDDRQLPALGQRKRLWTPKRRIL